MTTTVSGGGGGGIPGLTSDGADGIIVKGALQAGNPNAVGEPTFHYLYGSVSLFDTQGNNDDVDPVLDIHQQAGLTNNFGPLCVRIVRSGALNGHNYAREVVSIADQSGTTANIAQIGTGTARWTIPQAVTHAITGQLSAVTDANAKAVLTAIIAALTTPSIATDGTT